MSALDGFYATWNDARNTFGEGTPQGGALVDASPTFSKLGEDVQAAAPGNTWTGAASEAYGGANKKHGENLTKLADLDRRLATQLDQAADVVTTGRGNLDAVRQWVTDAANSVPPGKQRDELLMRIANSGLGQVSEIVQTSNDANNTIRDNMNRLKPEFQAIGFKEEKGDGIPDLIEDRRKHAEEEEAQRKAEEDVRNTLNASDPAAAAKVESVLGEIEPGKPLTQEQALYLGQMQSQQKGMSVDRLHEVEQKLGDHKDVIGDSWQLMSNDDVRYPKDPNAPFDPNNENETPPGSFDRLPQSVQDVLNNAGDVEQIDDSGILENHNDLRMISEIVADGNDKLQTGTEIDRGLLRAADAVMDSDVPAAHASEVTQKIFEAAAPDHQIIHDHVLGTHGSDGQDFLHDVNHMPWNDDGKAAGSLFSWTHDNELEPDIAAATAAEYARYLGGDDDLMDIAGQTLGEYNPELVKAYAHGLSPYVGDIAGVDGDDGDLFDDVDGSNSERPIAKGVFSVLSTQEDAYIEFNSAADAAAVERSLSWATDVKNGVPLSENDSRMADAAILKGLVAAGAADAAHEMQQNAAEAQQWRATAYKTGIEALSGLAGPIGGPVASTFGAAMENSFVGQAIDTSTKTVPDMKPDEAARFAANALLATGALTPDDVDRTYLIDDKLASREELDEDKRRVPKDTDYNYFLNNYIEKALRGSGSNPSDDFMYWYNMITKIPGGQ
ncbi:EspA/EspE family type VII secretion system effector [Mycobacterium sp. NPDC050551]|uniref:TPR repeat region-containing protein n=1 Tax=Mycobacterium sp. NPDC050551 TaxID=3155407 RepID=UPI003415D1E8